MAVARCGLALRRLLYFAPQRHFASLLQTSNSNGIPSEPSSSCIADNLTRKWHESVAADCSVFALKQRVSRLLELGLNGVELETVIQKCPSILSQDLEENLKELEVDMDDLGKKILCRLLIRCPHAILRRDATLSFHLLSEFVSRYRLEESELYRMLFNSCGVFVPSESNFKRINEFLEEQVIQPEQLKRIIRRSPGFFRRPLESLKERVEFLSSIGIDQNSGIFLSALIITSSSSIVTLEGRLNYLFSLELSQKDVYSIIQAQPSILAIKIENLERKIRFMVDVMKYPVDTITKVPFYLLCSLEERIKPRYRVISFLTDKEILKRKYALATIAVMPIRMFETKFLALHPDAAAVYKGEDISMNCFPDSQLS